MKIKNKSSYLYILVVLLSCFGIAISIKMIGAMNNEVKDQMMISETEKTRSNAFMFEQIADKITSGNIYEKRETQFDTGLDYDYSINELEAWKDIFRLGLFDYKESEWKNKNVKYVIAFYDEKETELLVLAVDKSGDIYFDDKYQIISKEIQMLLPRG